MEVLEVGGIDPYEGMEVLEVGGIDPYEGMEVSEVGGGSLLLTLMRYWFLAAEQGPFPQIEFFFRVAGLGEPTASQLRDENMVCRYRLFLSLSDLLRQVFLPTWIYAFVSSCYWRHIDWFGFGLALALVAVINRSGFLDEWKDNRQLISFILWAPAPAAPSTPLPDLSEKTGFVRPRMCSMASLLGFSPGRASPAPPTCGQQQPNPAAKPKDPARLMLDVDVTKEKKRRDVAVAAPAAATKTTSLHCMRPGVFNMIQPDVSDEDAAGIEREMRRLAEQGEKEEEEEEEEEGAMMKVFRMHGCRGMSVRGMHAIARGLQKHLSTLEVLSMWECQLDEVGGGLRIGELLSGSDSLKELDLTCGGITSTGAAAIGRAMARNTSLEKLRLTGNRIAAVNAGGGAACVVHKGITSIADGLANSLRLKYLSLAKTGIAHSSIRILCDSIHHGCPLAHLDLSGCPLIGDVGAERLGELLPICDALESLNVSGCGIGSAGAAHIGQGLCESVSMQELDMSGCKIGSSGACRIGEVFGFKNSWRVMKLSNCEIGPKGAASIANSVAGYFPMQATRLVHLDLSLNVIEDEGASAIAQNVIATSFCINLDLQQCGIKEGGTWMIGKALASNTSLCSLNIAGSVIGNGNAAWMFFSLPSNSTLTVLDLSKGGIGEMGAESIGRALKVNRTLTDLRLDGNKINDLGATWVAEGLARNSGLKHLHMYNCGIRASGMSQVGLALAVNSTLEVLGSGGRTFKYGPAKREAMKVVGNAIKDSGRVGMMSGLALEGLYLSDAWSELGLPRECSTWSNERIIEKWACDKEKLVAFGMGMHPRLGGAQGDDAAQRVSRSFAWPTFNMGRSRSGARPRHNVGTSAIYGMSDDVFKIVCSQVLYSAPDGTIHNR